MRRKGVPCACDPCKGKNYVRAVNNVSPDPNGDLNLIAGSGIGIQQTGDDSITITNTATPQSFVAGRNIELNPDASGDISIDLAEEPVVDGLTVNGDTQLNGDLEVNGDIVQNGSAYETHAEHVFTRDDYIIMRDGAVSGLPQGDYSGFQVKLYDGVNDGRLVIDRDGTARVGDVGDEQPLLTRDESADLTNGHLLEWDGANSKAVDSGTDVSAINTAINGKISGTGNIGSDTKPIKIVNGVAIAVTDALMKDTLPEDLTANTTWSTAFPKTGYSNVIKIGHLCLINQGGGNCQQVSTATAITGCPKATQNSFGLIYAHASGGIIGYFRIDAGSTTVVITTTQAISNGSITCQFVYPCE